MPGLVVAVGGAAAGDPGFVVRMAGLWGALVVGSESGPVKLIYVRIYREESLIYAL